MKRLLTVSLIVLFCLSSVFAGGSGETTGADNEIRVVTYFAGSDQWAPVWKEVIADYQAAHPEVRILDESQPTAGANDLFRTKIQSDIAARTPADLILFYNGSDAQMIDDSGMHPLETLFIDDGAKNIDTARRLGFEVYQPAPGEDFTPLLDRL